MFTDDIQKLASGVIELLQQKKLKLATAESCTGGLISGALTEIPGASAIFECGFVTYSNTAKIQMLGVDPLLLEKYGAVSAEVACAMAEGALTHSNAHMALATTGIAGPTGATPTKPLGLVHLALATKDLRPISEAHYFGNLGRRNVRDECVRKALALVTECLRGKK